MKKHRAYMYECAYVCAYPRCSTFLLHMNTRVVGRFIPGKHPNLRATRAGTASPSRLVTECLGE